MLDQYIAKHISDCTDTTANVKQKSSSRTDTHNAQHWNKSLQQNSKFEKTYNEDLLNYFHKRKNQAKMAKMAKMTTITSNSEKL